jgi:hypothetical protein
MLENWALHVYDTLLGRRTTARRQSDCIGETMQTSRKTLGPATDQGNAPNSTTTDFTANDALYLPESGAHFGEMVLRHNIVCESDVKRVLQWHEVLREVPLGLLQDWRLVCLMARVPKDGYSEPP